MNKLLLGSAVAVLALAAVPAFAQDDSTLKLNVGGHFKGYVNYTDQDDELAGDDVRDFDILRQTEVHFGGETTLDNGLTVGAQIEATADAQADGFDVDESYVYMAGTWGRVNFGDEDGAAYLLQVAAPSADDNIDGIRQFINPVNYGAAGGVAGADAGGIFALTDVYSGGLDYDNDIAGNDDKITYLTPVFSGFQAGFSWTPEAGDDTSEGGNGNAVDVAGTIDNLWEAAARYEGSYNNVGMILGGGYTFGEGDVEEWNVGADFDVGPFGLGAVYTEFDTDSAVGTGLVGGADEGETWVAGVDYTTGPFKIGASYLNSDADTGATSLEADRYTGGVVYTYGPGMSFRGSVSYAEFEGDAVGADLDSDALSALVGTQINF